MPVSFYMDVHIPAAITAQLRLRGVDVLTATEENTHRLPDEEIARSRVLSRSNAFHA